MGDLNTQIVREFFELHHFHVLTHWQHDRLSQHTDFASLLFVENLSVDMGGEAGFIPGTDEITHIRRAVVEVRAWHADRFYQSVVESSPILGHVAGDEVAQHARAVFGGKDFSTVLVISELPASGDARHRTVEALQAFKIGHVLEFPTILQAILNQISENGNYAPSQTLQTLRLLKRYKLIRRQQLEFTFPTDEPAPAVAPVLDAQELPEEEE